MMATTTGRPGALFLQIDELDFFGVDGALEKTGADADEALDGIGGEEADRAGDRAASEGTPSGGARGA